MKTKTLHVPFNNKMERSRAMSTTLSNKLIKFEELTKEERAAIANISLLTPPVPDGHLYLYRADVEAWLQRHVGMCASWMCRLLRSCLEFPGDVREGWTQLQERRKKEHIATTLFLVLVAVLFLVVFFSLFTNPDVTGHEAGPIERMKHSARVLESAGTIALGLGALWTATGVILSMREIKELINDLNADASRLVSILKAAALTASVRAWQGVGMLLVGTALLLVKIWWLD